MDRKTALVALVLLCVPACTKTVEVKPYAPNVPKPEVPLVRAEAMSCLAPDTRRKLSIRERLIVNYAKTLENVIKRLTRPRREEAKD